MYMYVGIYIHIYTYIHISNISMGAWPRGPMGRLFPPMGIQPFLRAWGSPGAVLWPNKRGSVLVVYMIKRSGGILGMMRCNERIRMQQSRATAAVNLLRYGCLFGQRWSPGIPWRSQGRPPELRVAGPGGPGIPRGSAYVLGFLFTW